MKIGDVDRLFWSRDYLVKIRSRAVYSEDVQRRLWAKTKRVGKCLLWTGPVEKSGYGYITIFNHMHRGAHAVALVLRLGRHLKKGMQANHNCPAKTKRCLVHVYEGTPKQNAEDRKRDGGDRIGEDHHSAKLCEEDVEVILLAKRIKGDALYRRLAKRFSISIGSVNLIRSGYNWKHVTERLRAEGRL